MPLRPAAALTGADRADRGWTYAELLADAEHAAAWLGSRFSPGEHVAVWAPNVPEWVVLQYGASLAGLVLVTANPALRESELEYLLRRSGAAGVVHLDAFRGTDLAATVRRVRLWHVGAGHGFGGRHPGARPVLRARSGPGGDPGAAGVRVRWVAAMYAALLAYPGQEE